MTIAPFWARYKHISLPIHEAPPVTITTLFSYIKLSFPPTQILPNTIKLRCAHFLIHYPELISDLIAPHVCAPRCSAKLGQDTLIRFLLNYPFLQPHIKKSLRRYAMPLSECTELFR